mmetsp:Transcript_22381/g.42077  ORF Transcript_22381/g.42077 Transcript_22381/m.42077 type:complete len:84 (-) Transcript_22381:388-639(-)
MAVFSLGSFRSELKGSVGHVRLLAASIFDVTTCGKVKGGGGGGRDSAEETEVGEGTHSKLSSDQAVVRMKPGGSFKDILRRFQ